MESISERIAFYRERIETLRAQHHIEKPVELMAVTKFVTPERINEAIEQGGIRLIGENRPQELVRKYDALHLDGVRVHQIGTLQKNKVKYVLGRVCMIESLDSVALAAEIDRLAKNRGLSPIECLLEVNIGQEENKGGILPQELFSVYEQIAAFSHISVRGLMTITPFTADRAQRTAYFSQTEKLYERLCKDYLPPRTQPLLSMGMTESFEEAILCGADLVRIGTGIFGARTTANP